MQVETFRGVMERRHPIKNTLSPKTKLAMKLHSKDSLTADEKDAAVEHWGQSIVAKQEVPTPPSLHFAPIPSRSLARSLLLHSPVREGRHRYGCALGFHIW
jgi:hypothetical protein